MHNASYFRLVTLIIPGVAGGNTGTTFSFDDQSDLRYARTTKITALSAGSLTFAQPQPVPVITDAQLKLLTLVLQTNDPDDLPVNGKRSKGDSGRFTSTLDTVQWMPFTMMNPIFGTAGPAPSVYHPPSFKDLYITWVKSKVTVAPGGLGNTTDVAIVLGVEYTFVTIEGKMIFPRN